MKKQILTTLALVIFTNMLYASHSLKSNLSGGDRHYEFSGDSTNSTGLWTASIGNDMVHFRFSINSGNVQPNYPFLLREFSSNPIQSHSFTVTREAGTMAFKGGFVESKGSGSYIFTPDKNFNDFLKSKGFQDLKEQDYLIFYLSGTSKEKIQELYQLGYATSKTRLLALAILEIDARYIRSWKQYGYNNISYNDVTGLKAMGITLNYANGLKALGYKEISLKSLIGLKALGVSADYIRSFNKIGFSAIPLNIITNAKAIGLTSQDVTLMRSKGHKYSSLGDYTHLKLLGKVVIQRQ